MVVLISGCSQHYEFEYDIEKVQNIEIVEAESAREYTVLKVLSIDEKQDFLDDFSKIKFGRNIGDPEFVVYGKAFKINYIDGTYEIICSKWAEYVTQEEIKEKNIYCSEEIFNELIKKYSDETALD